MDTLVDFPEIAGVQFPETKKLPLGFFWDPCVVAMKFDQIELNGPETFFSTEVEV